MLESYSDGRGREPWSRRWRRIGPAVALTVAAHLGSLAALALAALWHVDKLEWSEPTLFLSVGTGTPLPELAPQAAAPAKQEPRKRARRARKEVQPGDEVRPAAAPPPEPATEPPPESAPEEAQIGQPGGDGLKLFGECSADGECVPNGLASLSDAECGNGVLEPGEQCDDGGLADKDGCSARCRVERPLRIDNRIIEGYRISGDPQIHAPEEVRAEMAERGRTRAVGAVEMCLRENGTVSSLRVQQSTGYAVYDQELLAHMRGWRYRPYQLRNGTRVSACTTVIFIYKAEIRNVARAGTR